MVLETLMKVCITGLQFLEKTFFAPKIGGNVLKIGIAGFLIQLFLQDKLMKQPHFLHGGINSQKLKTD